MGRFHKQTNKITNAVMNMNIYTYDPPSDL